MSHEYKNPFTLDGKVKPSAFVSKEKVSAVKSLLERHMHGDRIASGTLQEALSTSDAIFNLAHLTNLNFVPEFEEAPRTWSQIAGVRVAPDLRPVTLYGLNSNWDGNVLTAQGAAPVVPEGAAYPYAYISGQVAQNAGQVKRGFKTDWTLESRINDGLGALENLPQEMLQVALDTEEADVYGALTTQVTADSALDGGTVPTGATVSANSPLSRDALIRAQFELSQREINGRKITVTGGYNLIVGVGQGIYANFILNQTLGEIEKGTDPRYVYTINGGYNPLANITVIESEYYTGAAWALLPKPGATRRPVLERIRVRGYETPEIFVEGANAFAATGGATVSPFSGSFASDVITLKLRQFGGAVLWSPLMVITSNGSGTA